MRKFYSAFTVFVVLISLSSRLFASPQMPDYIISGKDTIATYNLLLEQYLQKHHTASVEKLFGLNFRNGASFNCWRGYQAIYKLESDSLFLVNIIYCGERGSGKIDKAASLERMKAIFGDKIINDRVPINWFSGAISFPVNNKVLRWDGVFYTIYEKETIINITEGKILKTEVVENYIDDPKRIDRLEKNKIADILFKKLKKAKWKNDEDFDCSNKYLVTIDEKGDISEVKMINDEDNADDEYNFCINKVYETLKSLKFDIIKDKGKPMSEDIYIEIWIEDNGKIENWTR